MNRTLFLLLGLVLSINVSAVSKSELKSVYKNLVNSNKLNPLQLKIVNNPDVYAESNYRAISINSKDMKSWSKDQAAFILSHELGHSRMKYGSSHMREYSADMYGCIYMQKSGYNVHKGISIMKTWPNIKSKSHPLPSDRLRKLGG